MIRRGDLFRHAVVVCLAIACGYFGATVRDWTKGAQAVVHARRFEVVDQTGKMRAYLGADSDTGLGDIVLVFLEPDGLRRSQLGVRSGTYRPHLLFYGDDGPADKPARYDAQPRVSLSLGDTGSPTFSMRGHDGDQMRLGAVYGDVSRERELGWGLSFRAWDVPAEVGFGYSRWPNGYEAGISLTDGAGKRWRVSVGEGLKPVPLMKRRK